MRKIDWFHHASSRQLVQHIHEITLVQEPFSDSDLIDLQEKFLTNGFQYLKARNIAKGRLLIGSFLKSLNLYHDVAYLSLDHSLYFPHSIGNVYDELSIGGFLNSFKPYYLEEYFFDFYYDFMWIEANQELLLSPWFEDVISKMISMGIDQQIPIVVVVYDPS